MIDKRVLKTKNAIKNAFMQIMLEKDINKITVSDIAERALTNRSTFYLHYDNVYAVMEDLESEIANVISTCIEKFDINDVYNSTYNMFVNLSASLDKLDTMKKFILYSTNSKYIIERLKNLLVENAMQTYCNTVNDEIYEKRLYGFTFIASGMVDTYIKWSYDDHKKISLEELCSNISELIHAFIRILTGS